MFYALLALGSFSVAMGGPIASPACPDIEPMMDFDISEFWGDWYVAKRYDMPWVNQKSCDKWSFVRGTYDSGTIIKSAFMSTTGHALPHVIVDLEVRNASEPAALNLRVDLSDVLDMPVPVFEGTYYILGTDHETYAAMTTCSTLRNRPYLWILTSQKNPSSQTIDQAIEVAKKNGLDVSPETLVSVDQTNDC